MKPLTDYAQRFIGVPYIWGGSNPMIGFDCSGFIQWCFQSVGMDPKGDQNSQGLHNHFMTQGGLLLSVPVTGALCFYGSSLHGISHIALCLSDHQIIEAGGGDSTTKTKDDAIFRDACVRVRPFGHRRDLISIILPAYPAWLTSVEIAREG